MIKKFKSLAIYICFGLICLLPYTCNAYEYKFEKFIFNVYLDTTYVLMSRDDAKYCIWFVNQMPLEYAQEFFEEYNFDETNYVNK